MTGRPPTLLWRTHWAIGLCACVALGAPLAGQLAVADVIVLANRTTSPVTARFAPATGAAQQITLPAGDVVPLFLDGQAQIEYASASGPRRHHLEANCVYFFGANAQGEIGLQRIGLGEDGTATAGRSLPGSARRAGPATIPVKILVDEEEPARRPVWERRLRQRIEAASDILEKHSGVRLRVVAVDTWISDNSITDFVASLAEFEQKVSPHPARVAIGFTSQWPMVRGRTHMAGTRGPLHSHILVREGAPNLSEAAKLEFLVHELGHHLGATHSPEQDSVMRPVLGDGRAGRRGFRIQFDPVNTLVIAMIGEEIRRRGIRNISQLTPDTRQRLRQVYSVLAKAMPNDPAGQRYVQAMGSGGGGRTAAPATPTADTVEDAAKQVLQAIVRAATANRALPPAADGRPTSQSRRTGDELTDYYVREAAREAAALPDHLAVEALLVALGVGLEDSELLTRLPGAAGLARSVEDSSHRAQRLAVLGTPTMRGRRDLARHFFVSAYLTATMGAESAHAAGLAKELSDAQGGSGFSFADMAANRAGIRFAQGVRSGQFPLGALAHAFSVAALMPEVEQLPEGLSAEDFASQFGSQDDPRFAEQIAEIDRRIEALRAYRPPTLRLNR